MKKRTKTLVSTAYVEKWCAEFRHAIMNGDNSPGLALRKISAALLAEQYGIEPPRVNKLAGLLLELPPLIARTDVRAMVGMDIDERSLANLDSLGKGPRMRMRVGRRVVYPTAYLLEWIEEKAEVAVCKAC